MKDGTGPLIKGRDTGPSAVLLWSIPGSPYAPPAAALHSKFLCRTLGAQGGKMPATEEAWSRPKSP